MTDDGAAEALRRHSRTAVNQLAADATRLARGGVGAATQRAVTLRDAGSEFIRAHPLQAVLVAAGTGAPTILLASLLRSGSGTQR